MAIGNVYVQIAILYCLPETETISG